MTQAGPTPPGIGRWSGPAIRPTAPASWILPATLAGVCTVLAVVLVALVRGPYEVGFTGLDLEASASAPPNRGDDDEDRGSRSKSSPAVSPVSSASAGHVGKSGRSAARPKHSVASSSAGSTGTGSTGTGSNDATGSDTPATAEAALAAFHSKMTANDAEGAMDAVAALCSADKEKLKDTKLQGEVVDLSQTATKLPDGAGMRLFQTLVEECAPVGLDVLYTIVVTKGGSEAATIATQLLADEKTLARGTDAMEIAYALYSARTCEAKKALLARAGQYGDSRSLGWLIMMNRPCKRRTACCTYRDPALEGAIAAIRARGVTL
ncbi:MAG: hypothetical protein U0271_28050 [Polyangiaceae bacterium]